MIRGIKLFKCSDCGNTFLAPDIEYAATVFSVPQKCPECDSMHTLPHSLFSFTALKFYREMWKSLDKAHDG